MPERGDVVLTTIQFVNTYQTKVRPAIVLYQEMGNIVVAAITSNPKMKGVKVSKSEGAVVDSVIKLNHIFTVDEKMIKKNLFSVSKGTWSKVLNGIRMRLTAE